MNANTIYNDELPDGWSLATLDDILVFVLGGDWGKAPEYDEPNYTAVRCIRASEVPQWELERGKSAALRKIKCSSLESRELRAGDIIVEASGGGPDQPVGRTVLIDPMALAVNSDTPKICTNFFRLARPAKEMNSQYLNLFLRFFYESGEIVKFQAGSNNLRNLKFKDYLTINVPVPPVAEQSRIAAKIEDLLSELDRGIESLRSIREQLKVYRRAVLKHAFEGSFTEKWREENKDKLETPEELLKRIQAERQTRYEKHIDEWKIAVKAWEEGGRDGRKPPKPKKQTIATHSEVPQDFSEYCAKHWSWLKLSDVSDVSGGLTKNQKRQALPKTMKYLRVANVYKDELKLDEIAEIGVTDDEFRKLQLKAGDLLVVEGNGSIDQIGRLAMWTGEIAEIGHQNHLIRVRPIDSIESRFILLFLLSPLGRKFVVKQASSTSGLHTLSISKVSGLPIPVPCADEQQEIVRQIDRLLSNMQQVESEITDELLRCDALRISILRRAFSGQLVKQDPKDEPASKLLARIKAEKEERAKTKKAGKKKVKKKTKRKDAA